MNPPTSQPQAGTNHHPVTNRPVSRGPSAAPPPAKPDHTAMARGRSAGGKISTISDSVAGMTKAAPSPMTARAARITAAEEASPPASAPSPKTPSPASRAPLRP